MMNLCGWTEDERQGRRCYFPHQGRLPLSGGKKHGGEYLPLTFMYTPCVSSSYPPEDGAFLNLYLDGTEDC